MGFVPTPPKKISLEGPMLAHCTT